MGRNNMFSRFLAKPVIGIVAHGIDFDKDDGMSFKTYCYTQTEFSGLPQLLEASGVLCEKIDWCEKNRTCRYKKVKEERIKSVMKYEYKKAYS